MDIILIIPLLVSFFVTLFVLPKWIKKSREIGLVWEDMNKYEKKKDVAGSGGVIVVLGFILAILVYISLKTFYFKQNMELGEIFALTISILILATIGFIDDLLGWLGGGLVKRLRGGLSKRVRILMCVFAAVPLMVINAGTSSVSLPFLDVVNLGLIYSLVIIPIGIVGAAVAFNFLAGFNGLEGGQGAIILVALSIVTYFTGNSWLALICLIMVVALIAFLIFNKVPAKVFPGDVLTYPIGGLIAIVAVLGNIERIALFFFIPYVIEVALKARGRLKKYSFGKPNKDNSLEVPYEKIYGLEHFAIWVLKKFKNKVYEGDVVIFIHAIQVAVIIVGLVIFRNSIFI